MCQSRAVDGDTVLPGLRQLAKFRVLEHRLSDGTGLSRRQLLKRVGMAATVSLPAVASILAPEAAEAASGAGSGQPCGSMPRWSGCGCSGGTCTGTC